MVDSYVLPQNCCIYLINLRKHVRTSTIALLPVKAVFWQSYNYLQSERDKKMGVWCLRRRTVLYEFISALGKFWKSKSAPKWYGKQGVHVLWLSQESACLTSGQIQINIRNLELDSTGHWSLHALVMERRFNGHKNCLEPTVTRERRGFGVTFHGSQTDAWKC